MVDQTQMKEGANGRGHAAHQSTFSSTQSAARNMAHLLHDAVTLAQLQLRLFVLDFQQAGARLRGPTIAIGFGGILALISLPVALIGIVFLLTDIAHLTRVEAVWVTFALALIVAVASIGCGIWWLRSTTCLFESSRVEWTQNIERLKEMLKRSSHPMQDAKAADRPTMTPSRPF
jgi:uncharacterized membrane protein YqjE